MMSLNACAGVLLARSASECIWNEHVAADTLACASCLYFVGLTVLSHAPLDDALQHHLKGEQMSEFSHVDGQGKASMVDVSGKPPQRRIARAKGSIRLQAETVRMIRENAMKKGDVLAVARIAGIQAAKQTPTLIPLCHPLLLDRIHVEADVNEEGVLVRSEVVCTGRTGVEMEALTAVSAALLTVYDMCKAVDKEMTIGDITLVEKVKEDV